jgi:hypothetical protein
MKTLETLANEILHKLNFETQKSTTQIIVEGLIEGKGLNIETNDLNKNKMKNLIVNGVKFYPIDKENEIEIEREGWSFWLTIEETKKVIDFLTKQVKEPKQETHICKYCNAETTQSDDECYAKPKQERFEDAVKPLMKWLCENTHPHTKAIVTGNLAELVEGVENVHTNEFIVD